MNAPAALDVLALGEAMVEFNRLPAEAGGEPRLWLQGYGGDTSNLAIAAARQGARVGYASALGDDPPGQALRALWQAEGVDDSAVHTDAQAFTAVYLVTHGAHGHEFHFIRRGSAASRLTADRLAPATVQRARVLHLSGISLALSPEMQATCWHAIDAARAAGREVSFDTNLRLKLWPLEAAREAIGRALSRCTIALPGLDDLSALTGLHDPDALADHCLALGAREVALKLGAQGALVATAHERHRLAPHPCAPVDATGAGDTFGGAYLARRLAGDSPLQAGHYAAVAAALSTEGWGAVAPIPTAERVRAALAAAG